MVRVSLDLLILQVLLVVEHMLNLLCISQFLEILSFVFFFQPFLFLLLLLFRQEIILSRLSLLFGKVLPDLWWCRRFCVLELSFRIFESFSALEIVSDDLDKDVLVDDVQIITAENLNDVLKIKLIQKHSVVGVWLSHDLVKVLGDDFVAVLHHFLVVMLQCIQIQFENSSFIE